MERRHTDRVTLFRPADILCVVAVLLSAILLFILAGKAFGTPAENAFLTVDADGEIARYPLYENTEFTVISNGISVTVCISEGSAYVSDSECRDGVCRTMGKISLTGQTVICAPARFSMTVSGEEDAEHDAIIR